MNRLYWQLGCLVAAPLLLAGCVDGKYDFDDIDTTSRFTVNDLTIPINLKPIILENIIDLEGNENISVVEINGQKVYAIEKSGEVTTDPIAIEPVFVNVPAIQSTNINLSALGRYGAAAKRVSLENFSIEYPITSSLASSFQFHATDIDEAIKSITEVTSVSSALINIRLVFPADMAAAMGRVEFRGAVIDLPKGLYYEGTEAAKTNMGSYNPLTGELTLNEAIELSESQRTLDISVEFGRLDAALAGTGISNGELDYQGSMGLRDQGSILITPRLSHTLPNDFRLESQFHIDSFYLSSFSGELDYAVKGISIDPIDLSGLPEFLDDPETELILGNPQIYLGALNTTADYHTGLRGRIALNSLWESAAEQKASPMFNVGWDRGPVIYNIAMAPDTENLALIDQFPSPTKYTFSGLSTILSGSGIENANGLPDRIGVELQELNFYGNARNFPIRNGYGSTIGQIAPLRGNYTFYTPFSFSNGSRIIYSKTESGLGSEDLDKLYITRLHLTAMASNTLPVKVRLSAYPVDAAGNRIGECLQQLELAPGQSQPVALEIGGFNGLPFNHLDGVNYRAEVLAGSDEKPLSPDQTITLTDLRITADGYYETDL